MEPAQARARATGPATRSTAVVIPVRSFEDAKSRLGAVLDPEERRDLVERLLRRTVAAALETDGVTDVVVVSPDAEVLVVAEAAGARPVAQRSRGPEPRPAGGARRRRRRPPARAARGPAGRVGRRAPPAPRRGRRGRHPQRRARAGPARPRHERPPARSARRHRPGVRRQQPVGPRVARLVGGRRLRRGAPASSPSTSTRPTTCSSRRPKWPPTGATGSALATDGAGRVEILALAGLPEVREGDDLAAMIGDALEATAGRPAAARGRRPGRDPEGRVQGRGRGRRPADRRAAAGGRRLGRRRGAATRARSRSSCARRGGSCGWRTAS